MSLSNNLKILRNKLGLTQEQVSKDLKINRATYAHYETGRREPDIEMLKLLAKYYNVSADFILGNDISSNNVGSIFGKRLKELQKGNKRAREHLAKYLDVDIAIISDIENNNREPNFEMVQKIADFFKVSIDYLFGRTDNEYYGIYQLREPSTKFNDGNEIIEEIDKLSTESQEDLEAYIKLLKLRDMQKRNTEASDELATLD